MRSDYETRAKKFIKQIAPYLKGCHSHNDLSWAVYSFNERYHRHVVYAHGLTRAALVTSDYVVKFDFGRESNINQFGGCEDEMDLYVVAEEAGFDYLFAKIDRFDYNGHAFYIMPRIRGIGKYDDDVWEYLTEEEVDWLCDHNVTDLHCYNYGWKNNHPCLIDYGCFVI